jgi:hypothetical protein
MDGTFGWKRYMADSNFAGGVPRRERIPTAAHHSAM